MSQALKEAGELVGKVDRLRKKIQRLSRQIQDDSVPPDHLTGKDAKAYQSAVAATGEIAELLRSAYNLVKDFHAGIKVTPANHNKWSALERFLKNADTYIQHVAELAEDPIRYAEHSRVSYMNPGTVFNVMAHMLDDPRTAWGAVRGAITIAWELLRVKTAGLFTVDRVMARYREEYGNVPVEEALRAFRAKRVVKRFLGQMVYDDGRDAWVDTSTGKAGPNGPYNQIPGGLADKKKPGDFDPKQLAKGVKVEMEHTNDPALAKEIAMDHLTEMPDYYDKLEKVEGE